MSRTNRLEAENKRLSTEVEQMKEVCAKTSTINVKYKMQLEEEKNLKDELLEGNSKLKKKVNELSSQCFQQNEKIKMLEANLRRSTHVSMRASRVPVKLIGNVSEIIQNADPTTTRPYIDLQKKYDELESEHREALAIIDELEFELGDIDHLEMEVLRLQQENVQLREMLQTNDFSECNAGGYSATVAPASGVNYGADSSDNMTVKAFTSMKVTDDEEEDEHNDNGDFVSELKTIHSRKLMMQQKLESFHAKHSVRDKE